jgi:hypothetical protein
MEPLRKFISNFRCVAVLTCMVVLHFLKFSLPILKVYKAVLKQFYESSEMSKTMT